MKQVYWRNTTSTNITDDYKNTHNLSFYDFDTKINVMLRDKTMTDTKLVLNLINPKFSVL